MSNAIRWQRTKAGEQGVLLDEQRTAKNQGPIRSDIPLTKQIKGTMFEPEAPKEPDLFEEKQ